MMHHGESVCTAAVPKNILLKWVLVVANPSMRPAYRLVNEIMRVQTEWTEYHVGETVHENTYIQAAVCEGNTVTGI